MATTSTATSTTDTSRSRADVFAQVASRWSDRAARSTRREQQKEEGQDQKQDYKRKVHDGNGSSNKTSDKDIGQNNNSNNQAAGEGGKVQIDICSTWKSIVTGLGGVFNQRNRHSHSSSKDIVNARGKERAAEKVQVVVENSDETTSKRNGIGSITESNYAAAKETKRASQAARNRLAESMSRLQSAAAVAAEVENMSMTTSSKTHKQTRKDSGSNGGNGEADTRSSASDDDDITTNNDNSNDLISILPAGYDQSLALSVTSSSRTRAFHLLDLASVISSHRRFHSLTAGAGVYSKSRSHAEMRSEASRRGRTVYIRPEFSVMKNRDAQLLRLLVKLGVGLRCAGAEDVEAARDGVARVLDDAKGTEEEQHEASTVLQDGMDPPIVDDVGKARKPDGYLRRLMFPAESKAMSREQPASSFLAVDGPDEVKRISNAINRFASRKGLATTEGTGYGFFLVLPFLEEEGNCEWDKLVRSTADAAEDAGGSLIGVSVDLSLWEENKDGDNSILQSICFNLRRLRIMLCARGHQQVRIDLRGLPYPLTRERAGALTNALTSTVGQPITKKELDKHFSEAEAETQTLSQDRETPAIVADNSTVMFTADVTQHLVTHAGALCARIIGVKRGEKTTHYYIDDGCYGSLSSTTSSCQGGKGCQGIPPDNPGFLPFPLYGDESKQGPLSDTTQSKAVQATVWGPTCDGLDRVCESVDLPNDLEANRDWLIFPQLGCGGFGGGLGLGTAFNGFEPPDTAYCVLGYFGGSPSAVSAL